MLREEAHLHSMLLQMAENLVKHLLKEALGEVAAVVIAEKMTLLLVLEARMVLTVVLELLLEAKAKELPQENLQKRSEPYMPVVAAEVPLQLIR